MKVKWGALMVDGRNKIGGQVASKNRAGSYMRNKVTPVNPMSISQTLVRSRLTTISQSWRGLTQVQRDSWNAAAPGFAKTDIFGDLKNPSGFNLFQQLNNNLNAMGASLLLSPPAPSSLAQLSKAVLTYVSGVPALSLAFTISPGDDEGYKVFATAPLSAGVSFVKSEYRLLDTVNSNPASPLNLLAKYQAKFGTLGAVGSKIFVKIVACGSSSGIEGIAISAFAVSAI